MGDEEQLLGMFKLVDNTSSELIKGEDTEQHHWVIGAREDNERKQLIVECSWGLLDEMLRGLWKFGLANDWI